MSEQLELDTERRAELRDRPRQDHAAPGGAGIDNRETCLSGEVRHPGDVGRVRAEPLGELLPGQLRLDRGSHCLYVRSELPTGPGTNPYRNLQPFVGMRSTHQFRTRHRCSIAARDDSSLLA
jgi:hypothetical protein